MRLIEERILREVAKALIAAGMPVTVDYNEDDSPLTNSTDVDAIIEAAFEVGECWFLVDRDKKGDGKYKSFVYFVFDNGNDGLSVLSDYGVSLEPILKPIIEWCQNPTFERELKAYDSLVAIVREQIYGDGTAMCQQRVIDLCLAAEKQFGITREGR